MKWGRIAIALLSTIAAVAARAKERLPTIPPAQYTEEQKQAAADFESARKVPVFGPFEPLMYSPQLMSSARAMGDYLRYKSAIGNTLSELVILITAREWTQDYEWSLHYPIFTSELVRNKQVSDATFERAKSRLGMKGVVDMTGIVGYYTLLAMQLNVAQYPAATDENKLPRVPR
jgi:4-carboxymuconolactone decarboxylase